MPNSCFHPIRAKLWHGPYPGLQSRQELSPHLVPTLADRATLKTVLNVHLHQWHRGCSAQKRHGCPCHPCCNQDLPPSEAERWISNILPQSTLSPACWGYKNMKLGERLQESNWTHLLLSAPPWSQSHGRHPSMSLLRPQCSGCRGNHQHCNLGQT